MGLIWVELQDGNTEQEALLSGEDEDSPPDLGRLGVVQLTSSVGEQAN